MAKVLPEICVARDTSHYACRGSRDGKPHWPDICPACRAKLVDSSNYGATYACGAAYTDKPQCQTHTDVFWGTCPAS